MLFCFSIDKHLYSVVLFVCLLMLYRSESWMCLAIQTSTSLHSWVVQLQCGNGISRYRQYRCHALHPCQCHYDAHFQWLPIILLLRTFYTRTHIQATHKDPYPGGAAWLIQDISEFLIVRVILAEFFLFCFWSGVSCSGIVQYLLGTFLCCVQGLPSDSFSTENGVIVTRGRRFVLDR